MRTVVHIAFVTLYLTVTVGVSIATHLCGGVPVSTGLLSHSPSEPDDCCGPEEPMDGCCTTVISTVQINDDHLLNAEWFPVFVVMDLPSLAVVPHIPDPPGTAFQSPAGPPGNPPPLHILFASFLI